MFLEKFKIRGADSKDTPVLSVGENSHPLSAPREVMSEPEKGSRLAGSKEASEKDEPGHWLTPHVRLMRFPHS